VFKDVEIQNQIATTTSDQKKKNLQTLSNMKDQQRNHGDEMDCYYSKKTAKLCPLHLRKLSLVGRRYSWAPCIVYIAGTSLQRKSSIPL
jgi:hypothetical protein